MTENYHAVPCACGHRACRDWHVWPVAAVQSVRFTEEQARLVARLLNYLDDRPEDVPGPSWTFHDALRAVLLFYEDGPWGEARRAEWHRITGRTETTTRVLCDHARAVLAAGSYARGRRGDKVGDEYWRLLALEAGHVLTAEDVADVRSVLADYDEEMGEAAEAHHQGRLDALREVGGDALVEAVETRDEMYVSEVTARALQKIRDKNVAGRQS